jgi:sarcosine oxidase subunit beta
MSLDIAACGATPTPTKAPEPTQAGAGAAQPTRPAAGGTTEVFELGILGPFSGPSARTGDEFKGAVNMAFDAIGWQIGKYKIGIPGYDISLRHQGYLFVTNDPAMLDSLKAAVAKHHSLGVTDSEFLDHDELLARFPYLSERVVGATFRQRDGWLSSHEATQGFAKGSSAHFLVSTKATGILKDSQGVCGVETNRGTIATRTVVNAAGPFAGVVGRMAGVDLPLEPVRRQKVFISPKPSIPQDAPLTIDLVEDAYWRPETGGAYIAWVDPDEPAGEPAEELPTDWDYAAIVLEKLVRLTPFWAEIAATLKSEDLHPSAGQYVYTPDEQPLIGPLPELPGFYVNCGYWAGVMLSPEAGRRVARLVTGEMQPQDNALRPTRYAEGIVYEGDSFLRGRH